MHPLTTALRARRRAAAVRRTVVVGLALTLGAGALAAPLSAMGAQSSRTWYVAPGGSDDASGSRSAPLRTIDVAVQRASSGDVISLRGGTYHQSVTIGKDGLTLRSEPGERAVLDGAERVSGWRAQGGIWVKDGWSASFDRSPTYSWGAPDGTDAGWSFVSPAYPLAAWPDQVWVDGRSLRQVRDAAAVGPGQFAVDYSARKLYIGTDPAGRTVTASTLAKAVSVRGANTVLQRLDIRRFAPSVPHMGAVTLERPGARLQKVRITDHATTGLSVIADDASLSDVQVLRNGMLGIHASSAYGLRLNRVKANGNNVERFNQAPVSGGIKIHRSRNVSIRSSQFSHNTGTGIWFDVSNYDMRVLDTTISHNTGHGLFLEISDTAVVADNLVMHNGGNGILVDNTGHVKIWNNTVHGTGRPVNIVQDPRKASDLSFPGYDHRRPKPDPTVPWVTRDVRVSNNVLSTPNRTANCLLCVEDYTHDRSAEQMGVRVEGNVYRRREPNAPSWVVVWSSGRQNPYVYTDLAPFRRTSGQERYGRLVADALVRYDGRPTARLRSMTAGVARPLPSSVAPLVKRSAGTRHLGHWAG